MKRTLLISMCPLALGALHLSAATAAESPKSAADSELGRYSKVLKRCQQVENPVLVPGSALYGLDPVGWIQAELGPRWPAKPRVTAKIEMAPRHGTLIEDHIASSTSEPLPFYVYRPGGRFRGTDRVDISASVDGKVYLVKFTIQVVEATVDGKCTKSSRAPASNFTPI